MKNRATEFARLIRENERRIDTGCYMFSQDKEEVDDLFQEVLINLWKGLEPFKGDKYLGTWVWKVSLNTCINASRRRQREIKKIPLDVNVNLCEDVDAESMQIRQLHDRIGRLGYIDRSLVLLWLENLSYDEIGAILGISANNVAVRLVRVKDKLKKMSNN